jgi:hypothetical protein
MTTPAKPSSPKPAGDDRNLVAVDATTAHSFDEKMQVFWQKNGTAVLTVIVLVFVAILGKYGWDYMAAQKELGIEKDYAAASTPDQLKAFASSHEGHSLAGLALLRVADDAYAAGKFTDAVAGYDKALPALKDGPLSARAKLGRAIAKIGAGQAAEGAAELKQLSDDASQVKGVRAEATYHLASLAADAGNAADVQKLSEQLIKIDLQSPWTQRAMMLRASLPAAPAPAPTAPAKSADASKADAKRADASTSTPIKVPGK